MALKFPKGFKGAPNIFKSSAEKGEGFQTPASPPAVIVDEGTSFETTAGTGITVTADADASTNSVAIKSKTSHWSAGGVSFVPKESGSDTFFVKSDMSGFLTEVAVGGAQAAVTGVVFYLPVHLPHGAVVTAVGVYGSDATETWQLLRYDTDQAGIEREIASANIETVDSTPDVLYSTVDNNAQQYYIKTSAFESGDVIHGAKISYTIADIA